MHECQQSQHSTCPCFPSVFGRIADFLQKSTIHKGQCGNDQKQNMQLRQTNEAYPVLCMFSWKTLRRFEALEDWSGIISTVLNFAYQEVLALACYLWTPSGSHHAIAQSKLLLSSLRQIPYRKLLSVPYTQMGQANVVFLMLAQLGVCQQIEGENSKLPGQELCSGEAHTAWCPVRSHQGKVLCQSKSKIKPFPPKMFPTTLK